MLYLYRFNNNRNFNQFPILYKQCFLIPVLNRILKNSPITWHVIQSTTEILQNNLRTCFLAFSWILWRHPCFTYHGWHCMIIITFDKESHRRGNSVTGLDRENWWNVKSGQWDFGRVGDEMSPYLTQVITIDSGYCCDVNSLPRGAIGLSVLLIHVKTYKQVPVNTII